MQKTVVFFFILPFYLTIMAKPKVKKMNIQKYLHWRMNAYNLSLCLKCGIIKAVMHMTAYILFMEYLHYYMCNILFWMYAYCILIKEALKILCYYSSFKLYVVKAIFLHSPHLLMSKDWQAVNLGRCICGRDSPVSIIHR